MANIDTDWLRALDAAILVTFAIDRQEPGLDERRLGCHAGPPSTEAALACSRDLDLCRLDTFRQ